MDASPDLIEDAVVNQAVDYSAFAHVRMKMIATIIIATKHKCWKIS